MSIPPTQLIQLPLNQVKSRGIKVVRSLLSPLTKEQLWPKILPSSSSTEFAFSMGDQSLSGKKASDISFRTNYPMIRAQYFEVWIKNPMATIDLWYLDKAYLHLNRINAISGTQELVLLHCDPAFAPKEEYKIPFPDRYNKMKRQVPYKRLPHLHIKRAEHPFPKAHLALNFGNNATVLESLETLFTAMRFGIQMLKEEILDEM